MKVRETTEKERRGDVGKEKEGLREGIEKPRNSRERNGIEGGECARAEQTKVDEDDRRDERVSPSLMVERVDEVSETTKLRQFAS